MYLLDTNVISELRRKDKANRGVLQWIENVPSIDQFISAITVFELELGIALAARKDPVKADNLRHWLDSRVMPTFSNRILPVDTAIAQRSAALHVPDPRPEGDAFIAATALVHRLIMVTRNVRDFEPMGVRVFNPWSD